MPQEYVVAKEDIAVAPGVLAFAKGAKVPAGLVKRNGWDTLVEPAKTTAKPKE